MIRRILVWWLALSGALLVIPWGIDLAWTGTIEHGVPFVYYRFSSAPPPDYGAAWDGLALAGDLACSLAAAALGATLAGWRARRRAA